MFAVRRPRRGQTLDGDRRRILAVVVVGAAGGRVRLDLDRVHADGRVVVRKRALHVRIVADDRRAAVFDQPRRVADRRIDRVPGQIIIRLSVQFQIVVPGHLRRIEYVHRLFGRPGRKIIAAIVVRHDSHILRPPRRQILVLRRRYTRFLYHAADLQLVALCAVDRVPLDNAVLDENFGNRRQVMKVLRYRFAVIGRRVIADRLDLDGEIFVARVERIAEIGRAHV